ncbi:MAG: phospholipid carrier-dependent glycosyltransferase, partial [Holosporaceae bacterium]|nr:phospholipid carrier-dependent glycosyltransferase [Holosporaceae bacterium]
MSNLNWLLGCRGLAAIALILSIDFFSYNLGIRPFVSPSEARYVEIPREMVETGDYVTPRLNGLKYFEKPPLFYWLQAASIKAFGVNETSMRLWTMAFAARGCLTVFFVGASFYSPAVGLAASALLATNVLYYAHSRVIVIDIVFSTFLCGALWCFFAAFVRDNKQPPGRRWKIITLMYALSALACLTKGLIGAVLPGLVAFLWIAVTKNWKKIPKMIHLPGILVF